MQTIPLLNLLWAGLPLLLIFIILQRWQLQPISLMLALARMVLQLLAIGYLFTYLFQLHSPWLLSLILLVMMLLASRIALDTARRGGWGIYAKALLAIGSASALTLWVVVVLVLELEPWHQTSKVIPLAGMLLASGMTSISLAAERYHAELDVGRAYQQARVQAYRASLIPITNSLLAVGIVSLPGMMTGQILSGVSPLIAVRYQIMVMLMLLSVSGLASAIFLKLIDRHQK